MYGTGIPVRCVFLVFELCLRKSSGDPRVGSSVQNRHVAREGSKAASVGPGKSRTLPARLEGL